MNKILILGVDGNAGMNYVRSIQMKNKDIKIVGTGFSKYHLQYAKSRGVEAYCIDPNEWSLGEKKIFIHKMIDYGVDFIHAQPEEEVGSLCRLQSDTEIAKRTYGKNLDEYMLFRDKYRVINELGGTVFSYTAVDNKIFHLLMRDSGKVWIRAKSGAGSKWALPVESLEQADNWVEYLKRTKGAHDFDFIMSPFLPGKEFAVQLFFIAGTLIHAQARERVEHHFARQMVSGQSSTPSVAKTVNDSAITFEAVGAIRDLVEWPQGIYGVDMRQDSQGNYVVTEVNYGRYFTTNDFFAALNVNTPYEEYMYVTKGVTPIKRIDTATPDVYWIRGLDHEPTMVFGEL